MINIDYKEILEAEDISLEIAVQKTCFVNEFVNEVNEICKSFDDFKDLVKAYDSYWNSVMDILSKNGVDETFLVKDIVSRSVIESTLNNMVTKRRAY